MIRSEDIQEEGRNLTAGAGTNFEYMGEGARWDHRPFHSPDYCHTGDSDNGIIICWSDDDAEGICTNFENMWEWARWPELVKGLRAV